MTDPTVPTSNPGAGTPTVTLIDEPETTTGPSPAFVSLIAELLDECGFGPKRARRIARRFDLVDADEDLASKLGPKRHRQLNEKLDELINGPGGEDRMDSIAEARGHRYGYDGSTLFRLEDEEIAEADELVQVAADAPNVVEAAEGDNTSDVEKGGTALTDGSSDSATTFVEATGRVPML